ncbi:hypothetical protein Pmani_019884 [Petrolisthes manimaculis]|uniref:UDP-glucuronosyltransferase n=1 Tax=Petrolisthes manimaculis TaxID=1843537 RepID=A0AAE1PJH9_9EUCA|nr:hypothetical protein Pmani_019884 [Petrolisthes manimaculis]
MVTGLAVVTGDWMQQPSEKSYKILMLLPVSTKSHKNIFMPLAEALADRGHKVVMLVNHPKSSKHPNVLEINHDLPYYKEENQNMFITRTSKGQADFFIKSLPAIARDIYKVPEVKKLYDRRKDFDLIILNLLFNEAIYPFVHEMPFITIATSGLNVHQSAMLGNPLNPAYKVVGTVLTSNRPSAWQRFQNALAGVMRGFAWRHWTIVPLIQKEITAQFPDLPPLLELERNLSLTLVNTHFAIDTTVPLLPSQVEIGASHCRPANPLPQDIEEWISGAGPEGVIYFSLGSFTRGSSMPVQYRDAFLEAFRRLPHRVIWKFDEELEGVPDNVLIRKWLPQQDILGHEKVKVFISHSGLLSVQETVYHAMPILAIPIYGDQPKNAMFIKMSGFGDMLTWEDITVDKLINEITKITSNPKYRENIKKASLTLRDQITTPMERAVFWTEYVIRHQGAPQLRCPAANLSWVEFLMLDVVGILVVVLWVVLYVMRRVVAATVRKVFSNGDHMKKKSE